MSVDLDKLLRSIAEQRECAHITRGQQPFFALVSFATNDQKLCITQKLCAFCAGALTMELHNMRAPLTEQVEALKNKKT